MVKLKPGDRVNCRLKESKVINPFDPNFDDEKTFEIIGISDKGYYLFVPDYISITDSYKVARYDIKDMGIDIKYVGEYCICIPEKMIYKVQYVQDGIACKLCKEFYHYASPNQSDGTLICWSCRTYPPYY